MLKILLIYNNQQQTKKSVKQSFYDIHEIYETPRNWERKNSIDDLLLFQCLQAHLGKLKGWLMTQPLLESSGDIFTHMTGS